MSYNKENCSNTLINGGFSYWSQGTSFNSETIPPNDNNTRLIDKWYLLSDGNNVVNISQSIDVPGNSGLLYSVKQNVLANKRWGFITFIDGKTTKLYSGAMVTLYIYAKTLAPKLNAKLAALRWSGAIDKYPTDVIANWNSLPNPTLKNDWNYISNSQPMLHLTPGWARYSVRLSLPTVNNNNLAILFWVHDATFSYNDEIYISGAMLHGGDIPSSFDYGVSPQIEETILALDTLKSNNKWETDINSTGDITKLNPMNMVFTNNFVNSRCLTLPSIQKGGQLIFHRRANPDISINIGDLLFKSPNGDILDATCGVDPTLRNGHVILRALTDSPVSKEHWVTETKQEYYETFFPNASIKIHQDNRRVDAIWHSSNITYIDCGCLAIQETCLPRHCPPVNLQLPVVMANSQTHITAYPMWWLI